MDGQSIMTISAAVVAATQLLKWAGVPSRFAPLTVVLTAAVGVAVWGYSANDFSQLTAFAYFAGWIAVATSAAGVFGFSRSTAESMTAGRPKGYFNRQ